MNWGGVLLGWIDRRWIRYVYVVAGVQELSGPALPSLYLIDPAAGVSNQYFGYDALKNGTTLPSGTGKLTNSWKVD